MRRTSVTARAVAVPQIPRGWFVLGAALVSWMLVGLLLTGTAQVFSLVSAAI